MTDGDLERVRREQVLAFRRPRTRSTAAAPADLATVVGACGVQDTPPGNADVSLAARLDIDGPVVEEAIAAKKLVLAWSLRGAPHLFPPGDFAVFTLGARPADDTLETLWGQPEHSLVEVEKAMVADPRHQAVAEGRGERGGHRLGAGRARAVVRRVPGAPPEGERLPGDAAARAASS